MTITELVLLILNFTLCIVCLWLSLLKQKINTTRSMCNVERAPYYIAIQLQLRLGAPNRGGGGVGGSLNPP